MKIIIGKKTRDKYAHRKMCSIDFTKLFSNTIKFIVNYYCFFNRNLLILTCVFYEFSVYCYLEHITLLEVSQIYYI